MACLTVRSCFSHDYIIIIHCINVPGSILFLALMSFLFIALKDLSTEAVVTGMTR